MTGNINKEKTGKDTETEPWRKRKKKTLEKGSGCGGLAESAYDVREVTGEEVTQDFNFPFRKQSSNRGLIPRSLMHLFVPKYLNPSLLYILLCCFIKSTSKMITKSAACFKKCLEFLG